MLVGCLVVLGQVLKVFKGHTNFVLAVAISTDGAKILSGSGDRTVRVWSMETVEVPVCLLVLRCNLDRAGLKDFASSLNRTFQQNCISCLKELESFVTIRDGIEALSSVCVSCVDRWLGRL